MKTLVLLGLSAFACLLPSPFALFETGAVRDAELEEAVAEFSATTLAGGPGWEAYADFLHPDFSRWTLQPGASVMNREELVAGIEEWWEQGSCVGESESELVSLRIHGELGLVRRNVSETYLGPDGKRNGASRNHVTQVWILEDEVWRLLAMDIAPRKDDEDE